jgi:hypothetical protein
MKLHSDTIGLRATGFFSEGREYKLQMAVQRLRWESTGHIIINDDDEIGLHRIIKY